MKVEIKNMLNYHTKLIERMIDQTPRAMMGIIVVSAIYIWTYIEYVPMAYLIIWVFFQVLFVIFRLKNAQLLENSITNQNITKINQHTKSFFISMIISAFVWNGAVFMGLIYAPTPYEMLSLLMIVGIITGGVLSIASLYYIYVVYFFLMMFPQFFIFLTYNDQTHLSAAAFTMAYIPLIFLLTKSIYNNQLESISTHESLQSNVDKLHMLSITDSLTGIYNRRHFFDTAEELVSLSKRNKEHMSFLMIDIDHFKNVNDTYGHQAGDEILISLTQELKGLIRESDVLARMGGEEFAVLLNNTSLKGANTIAQKIRKIVQEKVFMHQEIVIPITISIGTAELSQKNNTVEKLYKEADDNLYRAKENGRNKVN